MKARLYVFVLGWLAMAQSAFASPMPELAPSDPSLKSQLANQRYHYELAKKALARDDLNKFQRHYQSLGHYPLKPYLDFARIKADATGNDVTEIDEFLNAHEGTFLAHRLREHLLSTLAKRKRWAAFLHFHHDSMRSRSVKCLHLQARLATGDAGAMQAIADVWSQGRSQPKACDATFRAWRRAGGMQAEHLWARFHNAMKGNKTSLARYVASLMNEQDRPDADRYLDIHAYPFAVRQRTRFAANDLRTQQVIAHGIKRLARKDPEEALSLWERYEAEHLFESEIAIDAKFALVKWLTYRGHGNKAAAIVRHSEELRSGDIVERLLRESLRNERYQEVLAWLPYLDEKERASDRWRYWQARAQDEAGTSSDAQSSASIYRDLATQRSFYGFLSADILNRDYALENKPSPVSVNARDSVLTMPDIQRTRELWLRGDYAEAKAEWRFALRRMSGEQLAAAGQLAESWGWYNKGIHAMIRGKWWDDLDVRFPLAYRDTVNKVARSRAMDNALVFAIARQESAFSENAQSSAGAMGLMQLMPATARQTARKNGYRHQDSKLFDPEYNIQLGTAYLDELLKTFNGNRFLAAAAYNAGPHRVHRWLKSTPLDVPFDIWIESIPFRETRGYVQNVLAFSVIYAHKLGRETRLMTPEELSAP